MRRIAGFTITVAALALTTLPLAAQDHTFHAAGTGTMHVAGGAPIRAAGTFVPSGGVAVGSPMPLRHHHDGQRAFPRRGYPHGYGYVYGIPYLLPYDSEYDQPEDRGTFEQPVAVEPQENRAGSTIFEHDGQASVYRSREPEREEPTLAPSAERAAAPLPPTVLVFRDGHQQEIESYAIAGAKLIVLGERPQKIQLSELDLDATAKVNDDRGVDFKLPDQT